MRLKDRLNAFMEEHGISHRKMASKISTPYPTFRNWMERKDSSTQPPACMVTLMDILERYPEARRLVGIE